MENSEMLKVIDNTIKKYGHFVYLVSGGCSPRFSYSIGLMNKVGFELLFAGGAFYSAEQAQEIINGVASFLELNDHNEDDDINLGELGDFRLIEADSSWSSNLLLGALDYFGVDLVKVFQIMPDSYHTTIDVPKANLPMDNEENITWKWFSEQWPYNISKDSFAITDLKALRGRYVIEATRWESEQWELFADPAPDVKKEEVRAVPLSTLLAYDPSLAPIVGLEIEKGIWRGENLIWQKWN